MNKKYWANTWEYKRIMQILEDYWLTEKNEDLVDIRMLFIKGKEYQTKNIRWRRPVPTPKADPHDLELTNLAELFQRTDRFKEDLTRFIKNESKELHVDEKELWGDLWALADEEFIKNILKEYD